MRTKLHVAFQAIQSALLIKHNSCMYTLHNVDSASMAIVHYIQGESQQVMLCNREALYVAHSLCYTTACAERLAHVNSAVGVCRSPSTGTTDVYRCTTMTTASHLHI